jgi:hypothetical protein
MSVFWGGGREGGEPVGGPARATHRGRYNGHNGRRVRVYMYMYMYMCVYASLSLVVCRLMIGTSESQQAGG